MPITKDDLEAARATGMTPAEVKKIRTEANRHFEDMPVFHERDTNRHEDHVDRLEERRRLIERYRSDEPAVGRAFPPRRIEDDWLP